MGGCSGVLVSGPLEEFAGGFLAELGELGYSSRGSEAQLRLMGHVSRWLSARGLAAGDLTGELADRFVVARRESYRSLRSWRALVPLLRYLRSLGVIPAAPVVVAVEPAGVLLERFALYLSNERGLAAATVRSYVSQVRPFVVGHAGVGWGALTGRQVSALSKISGGTLVSGVVEGFGGRRRIGEHVWGVGGRVWDSGALVDRAL